MDAVVLIGRKKAGRSVLPSVIVDDCSMSSSGLRDQQAWKNVFVTGRHMSSFLQPRFHLQEFVLFPHNSLLARQKNVEIEAINTQIRAHNNGCGPEPSILQMAHALYHGTDWCAHCLTSAKTLLLCGQCQNARYCSKQCQKLDWLVHKNCCIKEKKNNFSTYIAKQICS